MAVDILKESKARQMIKEYTWIFRKRGKCNNILMFKSEIREYGGFVNEK